MKNINRIKNIIDYKNISARTLEGKIGASNGVLSRAIQKNSDISSVWLSKIIDVLPDIDANWLLTGEGHMIKEQLHVASEITKEEFKGIPLIPADAMAGALSGNDIKVMDYECIYYVVPEFKDADFLMTIRGDSMIPRFCSGDIVACKILPMTSVFFQWNKVYVVGSEQGILLKRIRKSDSNKTVLLASENPDYDPFELPIAEIHSLAIVVGIIRIE